MAIPTNIKKSPKNAHTTQKKKEKKKKKKLEKEKNVPKKSPRGKAAF